MVVSFIWEDFKEVLEDYQTILYDSLKSPANQMGCLTMHLICICNFNTSQIYLLLKAIFGYICVNYGPFALV